MDETVMTVVIGASVTVGLAIAATRQRNKNRTLAQQIAPVLRERGPLTLAALADALGMGGFYARGKVVLALNEMVADGLVEVIQAPAGTPQLKKVDFIQYRLLAVGAGA